MVSAVLSQESGLLPPSRKPIVPSAILGTLMFVGAELMFFLGLISAYMVIKAGVNDWVPPETVRLPVLTTAVNTAVLTASGLLLFLAGRKMRQGASLVTVKQLYLSSLVLGATFVAVQGYEWVQLIRFGMTMTSDIFGACFFLLIGAHGVHALAAIIVLAVFYDRLNKAQMREDVMTSLQIFWFLIVGIWPFLYGLVYF